MRRLLAGSVLTPLLLLLLELRVAPCFAAATRIFPGEAAESRSYPLSSIPVSFLYFEVYMCVGDGLMVRKYVESVVVAVVVVVVDVWCCCWFGWCFVFISLGIIVVQFCRL